MKSAIDFAQADRVAAQLRGQPPQDRPAQPLDDVLQFLTRFVAYPTEHAAVAHALWVAHTHAMDAWDSTPRLAFVSPEPGSGKTRGLEATELLVPNAINTINSTVAYLFRRIGDADNQPTVLFDEADTVFSQRGDNEDLRGLLNAGHRRGATVGRCVVHGRQIETIETPAYAACALAALGDLPQTLLSRSVIIRMRRRAPHERVEPFRRREVQAEADQLSDRIAAWAAANLNDLRDARPDFPPSITDRPADCWESLLAVADAAGGHWPTRAREAAVALVASAQANPPSLGLRLLADVQHVFGGADRIATEALLKALHELDEAPWTDLRGKPLDARGLAARLKQYEVGSRQIRVGTITVKGYLRADLHDAWTRYLSSSTERETHETTETPARDVSDVSCVSDVGGTEEAF